SLVVGLAWTEGSIRVVRGRNVVESDRYPVLLHRQHVGERVGRHHPVEAREADVCATVVDYFSGQIGERRARAADRRHVIVTEQRYEAMVRAGLVLQASRTDVAGGAPSAGLRAV